MARRERTVFLIAEKAIAEGIPKAFAGVPFIIDEVGQPDRQVNEYLLGRRNGDWAAAEERRGLQAELSGRKVLRAQLNFLRSRAYQLDVFRRWCDTEGVSYADIGDIELERFAEDLEEGALTGAEGGIQPQSVNQYLTSILDFLRYAAERDWRTRLSLRTTKVRAGAQITASPIVMRRVNPTEITDWLSEDRIREFIADFETAPTLLSATIMYGMGLRISETLALRTSSFPALEEFEKSPSSRWLTVRGKGQKSRRVPIDSAVLKAVWGYLRIDRPRRAARLITPTDTLLIADSVNGSTAPLTARAVQKEFVRVRSSGRHGLMSPHLLRHHYAAHFLLKAWRRQAAQVGLGRQVRFDVAAGQDLLSTDLLVLKQSLGHAHLETTMRYLHSISFLTGSTIPHDFSSELDGEVE